MAIALPDKLSDEGAEVRVLLGECVTPADPTYSLADTKIAMQYMDAVLWNRVKNPRPYGARKGATLVDIIKAPGQFAGFENYPNYASSLVHRIQECVNIANDPKDRRQAAYADFVNAAIDRAKMPDVDDPSPGDLTAWRTAGHGSPGKGFTFYSTVLGNSFYYVPYVSRATPSP